MSGYYFEYDASAGIFAARFTGDVNDEVFRQFYASAPAYIKDRPVRAGVADFTDATSVNLSTGVLVSTASLVPLLPDPIPRYAIAPADHIFGMARMFQLSSTSGREKLFVVRSRREAYSALGVTNPNFERL